MPARRASLEGASRRVFRLTAAGERVLFEARDLRDRLRSGVVLPREARQWL